MKKKTYLILVFSLILFMLGVWVQAQNDDPDTIPPATIDDLAVSTTSESSIALTWTAPGDDDMASTAASYDLRYSTSTIAESNWASASEAANEPTPQVASSSETMTVLGLNESTTYYFAIKTKDEADNESDLSNVVDGTTLTTQASPSDDLGFTVNFTPESFNLNSRGRWVTVHLFLPSPYRAGDVDLSTVELNGSISPDLSFKGLNYFNKGNKNKERNSSNLVLKFSRSEFAELVGNSTGDFEVIITGEIDGESFSATNTVNVLGITLEEEETLVTADEGPEVYVIKNGRKRHIPSPQAFSRLGYAWQKIKKISNVEMNSYGDDELMKASNNPAVYLIVTGMKRHIPSVEVFESYGFNWDDISIVSSDELADYSDANLIRVAGDVKVYLLAGGKKHWVPTQAVFNKHGYKWENVIIVNSAEGDTVLEGENIE